MIILHSEMIIICPSIYSSLIHNDDELKIDYITS